MAALSRRRPPPLPHAVSLPEALALSVFLVLVDVILSSLFPLAQPRWSSDALWRIAAQRAFEASAVLGYFLARGKGLSALGLSLTWLRRALEVWAVCALMLGLLAGAAEVCIRLTLGGSFLALVAGPRVESLSALFFAAVLFGPLFEEMLFRGLVYAPLRKRFGVPFSALLTTALFVAPHLAAGQSGLVQAAGGLFFCLALEYSGSLWAPLLLHATGNAAIFLLPYLY